MIVHAATQLSEAWYRERAGCATASRASVMLARGPAGTEALTRRRYRRQLVDEILLGRSQESRFVSPAMRRGRELEPAARAAYAALTGQVVRTTGFLRHDTLRAGCSVDGDVDDFTGLLEAKAPGAPRHLLYLARRRVPSPYLAQITHQLWITGARWCDFFSYHPRFAPVVIRVHRADVDLAGYERQARAFLAEVERDIQVVRFFQEAPIDVARDVLAACARTVDVRRRAAARVVYAQEAA